MSADYIDLELASDRYVFVKFGEELDLERHFQAFRLAQTIENESIPGVVDVIPCVCTVMVEYDLELASTKSVLNEIEDLIDQMSGLEPFSSRLVGIPILFDDPWSFSCSREFLHDSETWERDIEFVARNNGYESIEAFIDFIVEPQHQVITVGFTPGVATTYPLGVDRDDIPTAPRYQRPRRWTPEGILGFGGSDLSFYPKRIPGGNYMIGRTPVPIYHPEMELDVFARDDTSVLLQTGDRVKYIPIDIDQFYEMHEQVADGSYKYTIEEQWFDPNSYFDDPFGYMTRLEEESNIDVSIHKFVDEIKGYVSDQLEEVYRDLSVPDPLEGDPR